MMEGMASPARKRTPRGQGRSRLLEAAGQLFAEQGVSGTSLQAIADRLGVTKAAVYHQFASKDEIVLAVAQPVIDRLRTVADAAERAAHDVNPEAARVVAIEGLVDLVLDARAAAAVLRRDPTMAHILDGNEGYRQQIARIDAALLGPDPTAESRIALAFAGAGIMTVTALPELEGNPTHVRAALIGAMTRALTTPRRT